MVFQGVSLLSFMVFQGVSLPCFIPFHDQETGTMGTSLQDVCSWLLSYGFEYPTNVSKNKLKVSKN